MCFAEADRVQIRLYLGASALWLQADSRLESAIATVQSVTCTGGTRADGSTEALVREILAELKCIDSRILKLAGQQGATAVPSGLSAIRLDAARETSRQRSVGRAYVHRLARVLDTLPYADIFSAAPSRETGYPNWPIGGRNPYSG